MAISGTAVFGTTLEVFAAGGWKAFLWLVLLDWLAQGIRVGLRLGLMSVMARVCFFNLV